MRATSSMASGGGSTWWRQVQVERWHRNKGGNCGLACTHARVQGCKSRAGAERRQRGGNVPRRVSATVPALPMHRRLLASRAPYQQSGRAAPGAAVSNKGQASRACLSNELHMGVLHAGRDVISVQALVVGLRAAQAAAEHTHSHPRGQGKSSKEAGGGPGLPLSGSGLPALPRPAAAFRNSPPLRTVLLLSPLCLPAKSNAMPGQSKARAALAAVRPPSLPLSPPP